MTALLVDMKSARLVTPAGETRRLRVFLWPDRIEAWGIVAGKPALLFEAGVASIDRGRAPNRPTVNNQWTVTTTGGDEWALLRDGTGCGCNSPLSKLRPERVGA